MTKSEKQFMERVHAIVFATPEIRNGQKYLDRKTFALLPLQARERWTYLILNKTR
jgi:hypothetical protein